MAERGDLSDIPDQGPWEDEESEDTASEDDTDDD